MRGPGGDETVFCHRSNAVVPLDNRAVVTGEYKYYYLTVNASCYTNEGQSALKLGGIMKRYSYMHKKYDQTIMQTQTVSNIIEALQNGIRYRNLRQVVEFLIEKREKLFNFKKLFII